MASNFPMKKNTACTIVFPILDADGDPVGGATELDSEYSLDGAAFADCTNEATNITSAAVNTGIYSLTLVAAETNGDIVCIQVKTSTAGAKTTVLVFYTAAQTLNETDAVVDEILLDTAVIGALGAGLTALATQASVNTIDGIVDDILLDTAVIGALGAGLTAVPWNAVWDAEVQSECDDALVAQDLDHLIEVTTGVEKPTDGSYLDQVMNKDAGQTFDPTTDSLEKLGEATAPSAAAIADQVWDETLADHTSSGSTGEKLNGIPKEEFDLT